jgi:hypothetical protein
VFGIFRKKAGPQPPTEPNEAKGLIVEKDEDGFPVIYSLVDEFPETSIRQSLQWLTVIGWRYDGSSRNGMPPHDVNSKMMALEDAVEYLERPGFMQRAYARTGNSLKEFAYYINDREAFMSEFNAALKSHEAYPLDIKFYSDPEWKDFKALLDSISRPSQDEK